MIDVDSDAERPIRTVTLDRPEVRNALTVDGLEAIEAAIDDAEEAVVYLRGAGPAFCAGADFEAVSGLNGDSERAESFARLGQRVARTIEETPSIVVAGIDGPARGGGLELALACDVRVGTPESTYGEPGVSFGLFGAWGGTVRLPRIVGEGNALELALTGRSIDAEAALRLGLISRIEPEPRTVATEIAANADDALAVLKRRLRDGDDRTAQEAREAQAFADLVAAHADDVDAILE
ncbi:enoyl-CoA hydratase/isomerase family protein [Natronobacterium gregoryi]|uniref:Enoyl-CoA hydratase n=2 Tax=Natronobacterium gregoryi TaxID=44930 RepID=L0AGA5_NATGS|nr:enoyl-CoA hydratase/isomerase family protein [Natronobacterium gregoryi]AFZ72851.1 enoyl-CoA hydratase/carnithine racemase [Natronobacterium gregoryi SP2]ELY69661.1 enoyl-CoA hydratase [Natronobacterium gregoryi SP2]PLK21920.1 enoyl-CoA hydratase/isomerase family protein [Natronobacterium gregoryi SP2]SFI65738.1 Enoyl-CoA hydratase/carnithine racemase [Natronobacterium gregoryi]